MRSKPILFLVAAVVVGGAAGSCYKWPASRSVRYRTNEVESDQDAQDAPQGPASRSVMQPGAQIGGQCEPKPFTMVETRKRQKALKFPHTIQGPHTAGSETQIAPSCRSFRIFLLR